MTPEAPETRIVETARVACDGGEGALGHPRVWLQIPEKSGWVECPYCACRYVLRGDSGQNNQSVSGLIGFMYSPDTL